ncbi:MAG: prenyltransferase [Candidatus Bathyarchaeia archaeon]|jgi:1,4-dihydroxy-2-naphthoate octaprenyltransferase
MVEKVLFEKASTYSDAALTFVDDDGYPYSVPVECEIDPDKQVLKITKPKSLASVGGKEVGIIFNHITPLPVGGYTDRRYLVFWGKLEERGEKLTLEPTKGFTWDEKEVPFFQYSEMKVSRGKKYLDELSEKPWLSTRWLVIRTFRLPFVIATILPVILGTVIAYRSGFFNLLLFGLTLVAALLIHLGVNTANDYFDSRAGTDDINTTPTPFSGGSRIIQYGLLPPSAVLSLSTASYAGGILIGLYLTITRGLPVLLIGLVGLLISYGYTAPPLKWAYRGLGEAAVSIGFGPLLVLGAYFVQTQGFSLEALLGSSPVGMLVMLILYVNEVPDRTWDDEAGKKTLVALMHEDSVVTGFLISVGVVYAIILIGAITRIFPLSAILALLTVPVALKVGRTIKGNLGNPYGLIPAMSLMVKLFVYTTLLLIAGYLVSFLLHF